MKPTRAARECQMLAKILGPVMSRNGRNYYGLRNEHANMHYAIRGRFIPWMRKTRSGRKP